MFWQLSVVWCSLREYVRNEGTDQTTMTSGGRKKEEMKAAYRKYSWIWDEGEIFSRASLMDSWVEGRFAVYF